MVLVAASVQGLDLYVDINDGSCSDSYTRIQASNEATPWCSLDAPSSGWMGTHQLIGGDTLYIKTGNYNDEGGNNFFYSNDFVVGNITIQAYPGHSVNLTLFEEDYSEPNDLWENISHSGMNIWKTPFSNLGTNYPIVNFLNGTKFLTMICYSENDCHESGKNRWLNDTSRNRDMVWGDTDLDEITIRLKDYTLNPNTIGLYITDQYNFKIYNHQSTDSYFIIKDLNFMHHRIAITSINSSNIIIDNCNVKGGIKGVQLRQTASSDPVKNIIVKNSYFDGKWNFEDWYNDDIKNTYEESEAIETNGIEGRAYIYNNTLTHWAGGITLFTDSQYENSGSEVSYNTIYNGAGSQIEIEKYCYNSTWHHNKIYGGQMGVSFGPAQGHPDAPCEFHHNEIKLDDYIIYDEDTNYSSHALKLYGLYGINVSNWLVHHNTFYGGGKGFYGIWNGSLTREHQNSTWINNIFLGNSAASVVYKTGEARDGVYFNNNLIWKDYDYDLLYRYNNDSDAIGFTSIDLALASDNWDGTWDTESIQADPLFVDLDNYDLTPLLGSPVCNASDTGDYIGALPCLSEIYNYPPVIESSSILPTVARINDNISGYCNASDRDGDNIFYYYQWYLNGVLNKSLIEKPLNSLCSQEFSNVSSENCGSSDGYYSSSGNWNDGDWDTSGNCLDENCITYYALVTENSKITIKYSHASGGYPSITTNYTQNLSIPNECIINNSVKFLFKTGIEVNPAIATYCNNASNQWYPIFEYIAGRYGGGSYSFYEESLLLNTTVYLYNESVKYNIDNFSLNNISKNNNIIFSCKANDGSKNSSWLNSTEFTVSNTAPIVDTVSIPENDLVSNLTFINTTTDPDNDSILLWSIKWYKNRIHNVSWDNLSTISASNTADNDSFIVSLSAYDGEDWGGYTNSSEITINDFLTPLLHNDYLSSNSGVNDKPFIIYINVTEINVIDFVKVQVTDPNLISINFSMFVYESSNTSTKKYFKVYTPSTNGVYTFQFFASDGSGNQINLTSSLTYTDSTYIASSGGSSGGSSPVITNIIINNDVVPDGYIEFASPGHFRGIPYLPTKSIHNTVVIKAVDGPVNASLYFSDNIASYFSGGICDLRTDYCYDNVIIEEDEEKYIYVIGNLSNQNFTTEFLKTNKVEGYVTVLSGEAPSPNVYNISMSKFPTKKMFDKTYNFTVDLNKKYSDKGVSFTHKTVFYFIYLIIGLIILLVIYFMLVTFGAV